MVLISVYRSGLVREAMGNTRVVMLQKYAMNALILLVLAFEGQRSNTKKTSFLSSTKHAALYPQLVLVTMKVLDKCHFCGTVSMQDYQTSPFAHVNFSV